MLLSRVARVIRIVCLGLVGAIFFLPGASYAQRPQPPHLVERWSGWEDLGGTLFQGPECAASQVGQIDCFGVRLNGIIVHSRFAQSAWSSWTDVNGVVPASIFDTRLECVSWGPNHLDCFVRRDDNTVWRRTYDGSYDSGWEALGGSLSSDLSCVSLEVRYLDCFGRGTDGQLYRNSFNGNIWSGWAPLGGQILEGTRPSCVIFRGNFFCIEVGLDSRIQVHPIGGVIQHPNIPNTAQGLGGAVGASFRCVVAPGPTGRIECIAPTVTSNWALGRWLFDGTTWTETDMGLIPLANGVLSYDFDCVAQQERVDCVDLIGHPDPNSAAGSGNSVIGAFDFRHVQLDSSSAANWQTVALTPAPNAGIPKFVRCTSWGSQRLDCFAAGESTASTHLVHAALFPQPILVRAKRVVH